MSCQHKLFTRISALTEKSFCLTGNPVKILLAILFLIESQGGEIANFGKKNSGFFNYYEIMLKM